MLSAVRSCVVEILPVKGSLSKRDGKEEGRRHVSARRQMRNFKQWAVRSAESENGVVDTADNHACVTGFYPTKILSYSGT